MSRKAVCPFVVRGVEHTEYDARNIKLGVCHQTKTSDGEPFTKYTPIAEIKMALQNKALFDLFKPGQKFMVEFHPINGKGE